MKREIVNNEKNIYINAKFNLDAKRDDSLILYRLKDIRFSAF